MEETIKTEGQKMSEELSYEPKSAWNKLSDEQINQVHDFCEGYKNFLDIAKTEREAVNVLIAKAEQNGFTDIMKWNGPLNPNDKVYYSNRGKTLCMAVIGSEQIENGVNVVGSHIDAPRLDLKPRPIYESLDLGLMKTHYYGGIRKYQWQTIPVAIHGVVIKSDGTKVEIVIGENESDPVFCITDLAPHLAKDQQKVVLSDAFPAENLNVVVANIPFKDEKVKEKVKLNVLKILNERYGISEKDFITAEIEIVPASKAKDIGLDRSMVGGYGQDDRACAYPSFEAIMSINNPSKTAICVFADKEEIGSSGNTGSQASWFSDFLAELMEKKEGYNSLKLRRALQNTKMLSADITCPIDPSYEGVSEKRNSSQVGCGIVVEKYGGSGGKYHSSEASAEFMNEITRLLDRENIAWQTGESGKVDQGGGGTIAGYFANLGVDVIDAGPALLSVHSPFEVSSKADIFMTYRAYKAFLN